MLQDGMKLFVPLCRWTPFCITQKNTTVMRVDFRYNHIDIEEVNALAEVIPNTCIIKLDIEKSTQILQDALARNFRKKIISPYYAASLPLISEEEKSKYSNLNTLVDNSSVDDKLKFAGGILMNLPDDLVCHTLSFLPLMNIKIAKKYFDLAKKEHPHGLTLTDQNEFNFDNSNKKLKCG